MRLGALKAIGLSGQSNTIQRQPVARTLHLGGQGGRTSLFRNQDGMSIGSNPGSLQLRVSGSGVDASAALPIPSARISRTRCTRNQITRAKTMATIGSVNGLETSLIDS